MSNTFVIVEVPAPTIVVVEQTTPDIVVVEEGGGGGGVLAGVVTFDGRDGFVGFELADAELIFTASGQLLVGTGSGTGDLLSVGSDGDVLTVQSGAPTWVAGGGASGVTTFNTRSGTVTLQASDVEDLFTAKGELFLGSGSGSGGLLTIGSSNEVLTVSGGTAVWASPAALTMAEIEALFTADGQLIVGTGSGTGHLLTVGSDFQVLTSISSDVVWATPSINLTGSGSPETAVVGNYGDIYKDTSTGALYFYNGATSGTDTGWVLGVAPANAMLTSLVSAGVGFPSGGPTAPLYIVGNPSESVLITDTFGAQGSNNGIAMNAGSTDNLQNVSIQLGGPSTYYTWSFADDGTTSFPEAITLAFNSTSTTLYVYGGDPNSHLTPNDMGDLCIDTSTPALWQSGSTSNTSWVNITGGGGGGSFPDLTGSGSPEGTQNGNIGQWYEDTSGATQGLYVFLGTNGTDTGWWSVGGNDSTVADPGLIFNSTTLRIAGKSTGTVVLTDVSTLGAGSGNGLLWTSNGTDGDQELTLQLGASGAWGWDFANSGITSFPGPIIVDSSVNGGSAALISYAGNPSGVVTAGATGDICFDTSTPAVWQATASGSGNWVNITGGGGGGSFPNFTGSGSPDGVQAASIGQWYEDTSGSSAGIFVKGTPNVEYAEFIAPTTPDMPLTVVMGTNDEFVFTPSSTGTPDTFTVAPGTYNSMQSLSAAMASAVDSLSNPFSTYVNVGLVEFYDAAVANPTGPPTLPLTVAPGVNDTFTYTSIVLGTPEVFTVAPGIYSTISDLATAVLNAAGTGSDIFDDYIEVVTNGAQLQFYSGNNTTGGDTVSSGPTDVLADLEFTSPTTFLNGVPGVLDAFAVNPGGADNGDTLAPGTNDVLFDLGFTDNPCTFRGGYGDTNDGWMQIGGGLGSANIFGLTGDNGALELLSNYGDIVISDVQARNGSGNGITWGASNGDYSQFFQVQVGDTRYTADFGIEVIDGIVSTFMPGPIWYPYNDFTGTYAMTGNEGVVIADGAVTLPPPTLVPGALFYIKDDGGGTASVHPNGSETIDGASSLSLSAYECALLMSDFANWQRLR